MNMRPLRPRSAGLLRFCMATAYENVPHAVATIVSATAPFVVDPDDTPDEKKKKLLAYTSELTKAMYQAITDKQSGL